MMTEVTKMALQIWTVTSRIRIGIPIHPYKQVVKSQIISITISNAMPASPMKIALVISLKTS